jgi:protein-disulfide isomerase
MKTMDKKTMNMLTYGFVAIVVILMGFSFFNYISKVGTVPKPADVSLDDHIRNGAQAKVVLVEYGDFQCPACGAYEPLVQQLLSKHVSYVQFVFRHFPLTQIHKNALLAAKYAEASGIQGKFWEMHDVLYARQKEWSDSLNAKDLFNGYGKELGLNVTKLETDSDGASIEAKIKANFEEGVKIGIQGTPTFYVNGVKIDNPESIEAFEKIISDN